MNEDYNVQETVTEVTENTDTQTVEQNEEGIELTDTTSNEEEKKDVKTYTSEEIEQMVEQRAKDRVNEILPYRLKREVSKIEKDYQSKLSKYEETESILTTGLGTKNIDEVNKRMRNYYQEQGINVPTYQVPNNHYSDDDEKALGNLEAQEIIKLGFDEIQEEMNRLTDKGANNMTVREKAMFTTLANEFTNLNNRKELVKIGAKKDIYESNEFKEYASMFNSKTPINKIYTMYVKENVPKKEKEQIGSMKNISTSKEIKEFYTPEEASKFTRKDYDKNPKLLEAVENSMPLWYKK